MPRFHRFTALAAALALSATACSGDPATSPSAAPAPISPALINLSPVLNTLGLGGFVACVPQPEAYAQATIDSAGGTITAGKHTLRIPAGALSRSVTITMRVPSDTIDAVVFGPAGLTFRPDRPAALTLDYSNCPNASLVKKKIVYTNDLLSILETLLSLDIQDAEKISAPIKHFSRYAVHY